MFSDRDDPRPGPAPELVLPRVRARAAELRHRRAVRTRLVGACALVVVAGVTAVVLVATLPGPGTGPVASGADVDRSSPLQDGNRVSASGVVAAVPGRSVRFCTPVAVAAIGTTGEGPPPAYCQYGVDVTGVDLAALQGRREVDGAVDGSAELHGVLQAGVLVVDRQGPPQLADLERPPTTPPCPEPAGGWATRGEPDTLARQQYEDTHTGEVVASALARPTPEAVVVLVLTAGDPEPVRAALSASYPGDQLCVATSAFSTAQIDAAQRDPALALTPETGVHGYGVSIGANGQPEVEAHATEVTPDLAAAVARQPEGLLVIDAWLQREQP